MSRPNTPPLDELRLLDPAPPRDLTSAQAARREAAFAQIVTHEHPLAASPARSRHRSTMAAIAGLSVAAIALAVVVGAVHGTASTPVRSYALPAHGSLSSWSATPSPAEASANDIRLCATALGIASEPEPPTLLTSDQRGDFTSLMIDQNGDTGYCVLAGGVVENWVDFSAVVAPPIAADEATYDVIQGADWMLAISGRAGADVTSVSVTNPETGESVAATLTNGVWAAWWPVTNGTLGSGPSAMDFMRDLSVHFTTADDRSHVSTGISDAEEGHSNPATPTKLPTLGQFAGWSATSNLVSAAASEIDSCARAADSWAAGSSTSVLADTRGEFESLLIDHSGDEAYCVLKAGQIQWARELGVRDAGAPAAPGTAALEQENGLDGVAGSRIAEVQGSVGEDVTAVTVHLAAGVDVGATVQSGRWMAWWPENEPPALGGPTPTATDAAAAPLPAGAPVFSWTTTDGVTHDSQ